MTTLHPNKRTILGKRLKTVAEIAAVRLSYEDIQKPLRAIDVGTDHAKLPMYLVSECGFSHVTATDINEGPCRSARENIAAGGKFFTDRIDVVHTDGLSGLENSNCDRIIIAGMGGELIRDILSAANFVRTRERKEKIKFVLQPQSKEHILRAYLLSSGFRILGEKRCEDAGKYYVVISAVFDGECREQEFSLFQLHFGADESAYVSDAFMPALIKKRTALEKSSCNRKLNNIPLDSPRFREEEALLAQIKSFLGED